MGEGLKRAMAAAKATRKPKIKTCPWICQCGDTTVVPAGERCPKCGKRERDSA